jgi:Zn-dependent protease with chaperone function
MVRYMVAAALGCVYVAASVWMVHNEGEAYRSTLRQAAAPSGVAAKLLANQPGAAAVAVPQPPPSETHPKSNPAAPEKASEPLLARGTEPAAPEPEVSRPRATPKKKRPANSANESAPSTSKARPKAASEEPVAAAKTPGAAEPEAAEEAAKVQAFWDRPQLKKSWDIDLIMRSAQEEMNLGRELHDVIVQMQPALEDSLLRRVEEAAEPLLKRVSRTDIRYTFTVLDSEAVNAFSTPGGFIYVSKGLFNMVGEDEDYALEFVLGHEIAHVEFKHALKCLQDAGVKKTPWGTIQKLYGLIIPAAFLDEQEYEADAWVYRKMSALGRTSRECLAFLNKLEGYAKSHGFENGRAKPTLGASMIDNHLPAHTAAYKRLKRLKEIRDQAAAPPK